MQRIASRHRAWWSLALFALVPVAASAQVTLPVVVDVSGNVATVRIGSTSAPLADVQLAFDGATNLDPASLGITAHSVVTSATSLVSRLPGGALTALDGAFPLLLTVGAPATGGLRFERTVRVEVHTHLLPYTAGTPFRLYKADGPLAPFRDITDEVAPGSVRARGTTGGFSQFLVLADLRPTSTVVATKIAALRARVAALPPLERPVLDTHLTQVETAVANGAYPDAIAAIDSFRARVSSRAGVTIPQVWRAARDVENHAGELLSGAATLKFSVGYLRDYGN